MIFTVLHKISKITFLLLLAHQARLVALDKVNPLAKISISSKKAVGKKENKSLFTFTYQGDVKTVLADGSHITSQELRISLDKDGISTKDVANSLTKEIKHDMLSQIKQISFADKVFIKRDNQCIKADRVELDPTKRTCHLFGNVAVTQAKIKKSDVPVNLKSSEATLNLDSGVVTFMGSTQEPVTTVLNLSDLPIIDKKTTIKKEKKREQNKNTTRA